jgi:hypothetical protein
MLKLHIVLEIIDSVPAALQFHGHGFPDARSFYCAAAFGVTLSPGCCLSSPLLHVYHRPADWNKLIIAAELRLSSIR